MKSLARYHTFQLPARAMRRLRLTSLTQLPELAAPMQAGERICLLGAGSNSVFVDDFAGLVVLVRLMGVQRLREDAAHLVLRVRAGESWAKLAWWASAAGYWGLENLVDIPGTVGAAPMQNIGAYGAEVASLIESVEGIDLATQQAWRLSRDECAFAYRNSVFKSWPMNHFLITAVTLRLNKTPAPQLSYPDLQPLQAHSATLTPLIIAEHVRRFRAQKLPDPRLIGNAGSFFKNPIIPAEQAQRLQAAHPKIPCYPQGDGKVKVSAGWLIEQCGFKGMNQGAVGVSAQHALVLIHNFNLPPTANPPQQDLIQLIQLIQSRVQEAFNVNLDPEPIIYGEIYGESRLR